MVKFCRHCGARVEANGNFCPNCGAKISNETAGDTVSTVLKFMGGIFALFAVMAILEFGLTSSSDESSSQFNQAEVAAEPMTEADFLVDGLTLGMSRAQFERKLGKPTKIHAGDWYEFGKNIGVHFKGGKSADVIGIGLENFGTSRNIFGGSTLAEVEKAYGTNYRRYNSNDKEFTIEYSLGEKLLAFMLDNVTNRVTTIFLIEDISTFIPPEKSQPQQVQETPKPQPKPQPKVDNRAAAERVLSDFTAAFLNRDRAGMEGCSFYEPRNFSKEKGYEMLDKQVAVLDIANDIHRKTFGAAWEYTFEIFGMSKVNADTYDAEIVFILGPDTLRCSGIRVRNVNGRWLVDADSFAFSTSLNFTRAVYSGY